MNTIDLLSKQLENYQEQNVREHETLSKKFDQMLSEIHILFSERNLNEDKFNRLEEGQKEIKETADSIDNRVQNLEEHHLKSQHSWGLSLKVLGILATVGAIAGIVLKFSGI